MQSGWEFCIAILHEPRYLVDEKQIDLAKPNFLVRIGGGEAMGKMYCK